MGGGAAYVTTFCEERLYYTFKLGTHGTGNMVNCILVEMVQDLEVLIM